MGVLKSLDCIPDHCGLNSTCRLYVPAGKLIITTVTPGFSWSDCPAGSAGSSENRTANPVVNAAPEGAFYAFVDVRNLLGDKFKTSADLADMLLNEAHIAVTDGAGFGADGFLRISYATSLENLQTAVERIKKVFATAMRETA